MSHWASMSRDQRIGAIFRFTKDGKTAPQIATALATSSNIVSTFANRYGLPMNKVADVAAANRDSEEAIGMVSNRAGGIWGLPADMQRMANWRRAQKAAREAREALARAS